MAGAICADASSMAAAGNKGHNRQTALTGQLPAGAALRLICGEQLSAIERHLPGALRGYDPEALHDLRVAVRRTRSVLSEFRKLFPQAALSHFRGEFRWVGEITGPVRDLDVYLERLPDYEALLTGDSGATLAPFRRYLMHQRRLEQRRLARRLSSKRFAQLLLDWQDLLASGDDSRWPAKAVRATGEVARRHTWKLYRDFIRQGEAIAGETPDQALHRLRITGKKLRYLVEFFRPLYPPAEIELLVKAMKRVQDYLGSYQDCTVQQQRLKELAGQMSREGEVPTATTAALGGLIVVIKKQQQQLRGEFPKQFKVFSHGRGRRGFIRLYAPAEHT